MSKKKVEAGVVMQWMPVSGFTLPVEREDGRKLAVSVWLKDVAWAVLALETKLPMDDEAILDDHAHKIVGTYPTPGAAFEAAESFARAWLKDFKATRSKQCECAELSTTGV